MWIAATFPPPLSLKQRIGKGGYIDAWRSLFLSHLSHSRGGESTIVQSNHCILDQIYGFFTWWQRYTGLNFSVFSPPFVLVDCYNILLLFGIQHFTLKFASYLRGLHFNFFFIKFLCVVRPLLGRSIFLFLFQSLGTHGFHVVEPFSLCFLFLQQSFNF
jgi:hypothetical protein